MLNQSLTQKIELEQIQTQTNKIRSMSSILQFNDQNQQFILLNIDLGWLKLQALTCKTRGQFKEKVFNDLHSRNNIVKNSIQSWYKQTQKFQETQPRFNKIHSQLAQQYEQNLKLNEQKSIALPILKPLSFAFQQQCENKYKKTRSSQSKKVPLQISSVQCPINTVEFKKSALTNGSIRLHANRLKTVIEIKLLQDKQCLIISDQNRELNSIYPTVKARDQVETLYSQFFGSVNRKRAVTICNNQQNIEKEFEVRSGFLENKFKINKF